MAVLGMSELIKTPARLFNIFYQGDIIKHNQKNY